MLIDWFTVGAQALNFALLVVLMRWFLYKPVLHAIAEREKRIAGELADAATKQAEATAERDELRRKKKELDGQRDELLRKAKDDASAERKRLTDEARTAADALRAKQAAALANEAHASNQALCRRAGEEVFAIARKALTDLATTSLEERMADVLTRRLGEMDGEAKKAFAAALAASSAQAVVRSAFELPEAQRAAIKDALNRALSADVPVRFEAAPDLISGVEIAVGGRKLSWTLSDYLATLEKDVADLLAKHASSAAPAPQEQASSEPPRAPRTAPSEPQNPRKKAGSEPQEARGNGAAPAQEIHEHGA